MDLYFLAWYLFFQHEMQENGISVIFSTSKVFEGKIIQINLLVN